MLRIIHCLDSMNRGGIETFIMNIYRNIDRGEIQFDFLLSSEKEDDFNEEIRSLGGRIFRIPPRRNGVIRNRRALDEFFENHKEYTVIHQHVGSLTYIEPLKIAKKKGVPIRIVHSHNTKQGGRPFHKYIHKFNQLFIKDIATHYFACSDLAANWLYSKKQYHNNEFRVINNAIDAEKFVFNKEIRGTKRKELGIEDRFVLGHIGRFTYQKNHDFLIDIFKEVNDREKKSVLLLVGDGKLHESIKEKVRKLELQDSVIFTGVRSDIAEILQAMDVFVMPSYHEGLPVTIVEAQAADLPCVLSENITSEVGILNGIKWCNLNDEPSIWGDNILYFMKNNCRSNTRQEIVDAGFDTKSVLLELEKVYTCNMV